MITDIRQSAEFAQYLSLLGWHTQRFENTNYFFKKLFGIFTVCKIQRPDKINFKAINKFIKTHRPLQIVLEPIDKFQAEEAKKFGFKIYSSSYLPSKTLELNLTWSQNKLVTNLKKDARGAINKNNKLNLRKYSLDNLTKFRDIWKNNVSFQRYVPPVKNLIALKKTYGNNSLFITSKENTSGAIFLISGSKAYYWQAFTGKVGRAKKHQYKIVWEGILWAKSKGARVFDFEGIYDERFPNKDWLGFTHFKKSFNGNEILYPGCFTSFHCF
jgi:lipid II:glycine glycyltransferase (peptidoglycan interpeptide bridge formation enzyme)